jgi:GxxExxY protein
VSRFGLFAHIHSMETRDLSPLERKLTHSIIGAALIVHREFGPGLLESAYEECLAYELGERGLSFERQAERPIVFRGIKLSVAYRPDLVVEKTIVVELKTVERFIPVHTAQLLTYLKLEGLRVGLLLNFNSVVLANGIKRVVL